MSSELSAPSALSVTLGVHGGGHASTKMSGGGGNFGSLIAEKSTFLVHTFLMLIAQMLVTLLVTWSVSKKPQLAYYAVKKLGVLFAFTLLSLLIVIAFMPMSRSMKAVLFTVFSTLIGFLIGSIAAISEHLRDIIWDTFLSIIVIFVYMVLLGVAASAGGVSAAWLGVALFFPIIGAWISYLMKRNGDTSMSDIAYLKRMINMFMIFLFSLYIIFDTWAILKREYAGDFVTASFDYYLDIINLFFELLKNAVRESGKAALKSATKSR